MNTQNIMSSSIKGLVSTGMIAMLVACGGSDDNAATSESVVARGVITQLGSIWVLGVEYETPDGNSYSSDDSPPNTIADYKVGQVVRIRGSRNNDSISGTADEVEYEAEIEGAADANGDINGVVIVPASNINAPGIPDPLNLNPGTRYEVSGIWLGDTTIEATFIKVDDDNAPGGDNVDEIKGIVKNDGASSFDVRGITFNWTGTPDVFDDDYVEVHFDSCTAPPNVVCTANRVEHEDDFNDNNEGQEVEFEGTVNMNAADLANCPAGANFLIDTTCIDWDLKPAIFSDGLDISDDVLPGIRVEAEGHVTLVAGKSLLVAEKIKGRGNRVRITSTVTAGSVVSGTNPKDGTFALLFGHIEVTTSDATFFDPNLGIAEDFSVIADGIELEVRGIRTVLNTMLATSIKAKSVSADRHELRAVVDSIDPTLLPNGGADSSNNTITVMGVTAVAGADTKLEIEDVQIAPVPPSSVTMPAEIDSFLEMIDDDGIVSISNGPNDVVDVRIDTTTGGDGSIGSPYEAVQIEIEEEDD